MKQAGDFAVGDTFRAVREVDRFRPVYYASASGDFNPLHVDPEVGRAAGFRGAILQGMCTYSWAAEACVEYLGDPARLRRLGVRFSRPVQAGDTLTFEGRCVAVEGATVRLELTARNQAGEDVLKGAVAEGRVGDGGSATVPVDRAHLGRRYGPYVYGVGREDLRNFTAAIAGGIPGRAFASTPPARAHPFTWDEDAARAGPHGGLVAAPGFATVWAIEPFAAAVSDPALGLDLVKLLHGEQELEWLEPVRPGDRLETLGEITRLGERGNMDLVEVTTTTTNQHGRVVVRGVWTAVIRR